MPCCRQTPADDDDRIRQKQAQVITALSQVIDGLHRLLDLLTSEAEKPQPSTAETITAIDQEVS